MLDLVLDTAPTTGPVPLDAAKAHLRIDDTDQDAVVQACLDAGVAYLDGPSGILGRALVEQTWTLYLDRFPCFAPAVPTFLRRHRRHHPSAIRLPLPPLISVGSIAYVDVNGADQTVAAGDYVVREGEAAVIEPARGFTWPATACQPRAVTVTFTCGYGAAADVPAAVKAALMLLTGDLFENRETQLMGQRAAQVESQTFRRLVAPFKVART